MNIIRKGTDSVITTIAFVIAFIWLIPLIWIYFLKQDLH